MFSGVNHSSFVLGADSSEVAETRVHTLYGSLSYHLLSLRTCGLLNGTKCARCAIHSDDSKDIFKTPDSDIARRPTCGTEYIGCDCRSTKVLNYAEDRETTDTLKRTSNTASSAIKSTFSAPFTCAVPLVSQLLCSNVLHGKESASELSIIFQTYLRHGDTFAADTYFRMLNDFVVEQGDGLRQNPSSLKMLSRFVIRYAVLKNGCFQELDRLPLPKMLLDFLGLKSIT